MKCTVLGADGVIGGACVRYFTIKGYEVTAVSRRSEIDPNSQLGHVIYAIGLTGDFRERPFETVDAHVTVLAYWLQNYLFDSFTYLSSTRVFESASHSSPVSELTPVTLMSSPSTLYDLSKLLGEALCLTHSSRTVRVVRLSNVYGPQQSHNNFLGSVMRSLKSSGEVVIRESSDSAKDYVSQDDVVQLLFAIATTGCERLYHVASGTSVSHRALADAMQKEGRGKISFVQGAPCRRFPIIDISRVRTEFGFSPRYILNDLKDLFKLDTV